MKKFFGLSSTLLMSASLMATDCASLPKWSEVKEALIKVRGESNGGFNLDMWATLVNRDGEVCVVTFTAGDRGGQWPGSRVISAQKANTANAFSLPKLALSTANLYSAVQPGGSLFGLQESNPVNVAAAYGGNSKNIGSDNDPLVGEKIGGVNVFGGGLALYNKQGVIVGGLGVSGDSSCADHNIAWKLRKLLQLDFVPAGVSPANNDNIIYLKKNEKANGFKHPLCGGTENKITLDSVSKI
ncbi:MAG: heme-binding protein [Proteobacteria bacterium]|nr:heme-binding protein [Pseudomonadota bacterium]